MAKRWLGLLLLVLWIGSSGVAHATVTETPDPLDIGNVSVTKSGTADATLSVDVTTTNVTVQLRAGGDCPQFQITSPTSPVTIDPGAGNDQMVSVKFTPTSSGTKTCTVDVKRGGNVLTSFSVTGIGDQGVVTTIPTSHDFAGVPVGMTVPFNFTLKNTGNVTISNLTGALADTTKGYVFDPATVPTSLAAGGSMMLTVKFAPQSGADGGPVNLTFNAVWGASNTPTTATLALNGDGQIASFTATPTPLAFGNFRFDSQPQKIYHIKNNGDLNVSIDIASFAPDPGTAATEFTFTIKKGAATVTLPQTLLPNEQLDVTVTAVPNNRTGPIGGQVTVHSTTTGTTDQQVTITGTATAAAVMATATIDFGAVDIAATPSPTKTISIKNTGDADLDISSIAPAAGSSAAFTFALPTLPTKLAPNTTLDIIVTYKPTTVRGPGDFDTAVLVASYTGALGGPSQSMTLCQGRGIDNSLVIQAPPIFPTTFRNPGDKAPLRMVTVRNNGEAPLRISAVMVTGGPVWQVVDANPIDIPGGNAHDFIVKFSPTMVGAAPTGQLTLVNNDNTRPTATVTLNGTCMDRMLAVNAAPISFGYTRVGLPITAADILAVTNMDPNTLFMIHMILLDDDSAFHIDNAPADDVLAAKSAQSFGITFAPTKIDHFEATAFLYIDQDRTPQAAVKISGDAVSVDVHGGGGCATGHGLGGGAVIFVFISMGLVARRRRAAGLLVALAVLPVRAFGDDIRVGAFDPTPATRGTGFQLDSADVGNHGDWVASGVFSYATNSMVISELPVDRNLIIDRPISQRAMVELGGAYAFLGRFEAGVRMPLYSQNGDPLGNPMTGLAIRPASGTALGDLTLHAKLRLVHMRHLTAGAALHGTLPTSTKDQFTGTDLPTIHVLGLATFAPISRLTLSFNGGAVLRKTADYRKEISIEQGSGLAWGAGASFRIANDLFAIGEVFGEWVPKAREMTGSLSPIEALFGVSYRIERRFTVGVAVGRGITNGLGAPDLRGTFTLSVASGGRLVPVERGPALARVIDTDGDGIPDDKDRCPNQPEDKNGFQDDDGCPDLDSDHDGIPDWRDKCPDQPETMNGLDDDDGCPDGGGDTSTNAEADSDQVAAKTAEEAFLRGRELMKQKKYFAACAAFEQSQHLDPAAGTQYNLAGCYAEIGKFATALTLYRELALVDKNAERRAKSDELATQLTPRVPKLKMILKGAPAGVNVSMNGTNVNALLGIETPIDLGTYTIIAGAPKYRDWRQTVEIKKEGEVTTIEIDLGPQSAP